MTTVASRLRANKATLSIIRERSGWSVSRLATEVGISTGYLCNLEAGRKAGSPEVLRKIADVLKVPITAITTVADDQAAVA